MISLVEKVATTGKKATSELFGVAMCQVGLALAFVIYILTSAALMPVKFIESQIVHYQTVTACDWIPPVMLSFMAGCLLWLYRRKMFNSVYISLGLLLAALGVVLFSVTSPVALIMLFCFAGSWSLLFDAVLPQSGKWKTSRLLLVNLLIFFLGLGFGVLAFIFVSAL